MDTENWLGGNLPIDGEKVNSNLTQKEDQTESNQSNLLRHSAPSIPGSPLNQSQQSLFKTFGGTVGPDGKISAAFSRRNNIFVSVDGVIAAYKSTTVRAIEIWGGKAIKGYIEPSSRGNPMMHLYYQNQKLYAVPMQLFSFHTRIKITIQILKDMMTAIQEGQAAVFICERAWPGDSAFKEANVRSGYYTKEESEEYDLFMDRGWKCLPIPNIFIQPVVTPDESLRRILIRGRTAEKNVPIEYLKSLEQSYEKVKSDIIARGGHWSEVGADTSPEEIFQTINDFADGNGLIITPERMDDIEALRQDIWTAYEKSLEVRGLTHAEVEKSHAKYIADEQVKEYELKKAAELKVKTSETQETPSQVCFTALDMDE